MGKKRIIGVVGPRNTPVGEDHHNAVLTDAQVEEIRVLYETLENGQRKYGYRKLAAMFKVNRTTIRDIVTFRRRACTPDSFKTIRTQTSIAALRQYERENL